MNPNTANAALKTPPSLLFNDRVFIEDLRRQMIRFATLQLSDSSLAEDAVQEALAGALKNCDAFAGRAAFKTWVFAILKNKIADTLRNKQRSATTNFSANDDNQEDLSELFNAQGYWEADEHPANWGNPSEALQREQFWKIFEICLDNLPGQQAQIFMMREYIELDSKEICASVGISVSNLNVSLYRARLRLRECLEDRWFAVPKAAQS